MASFTSPAPFSSEAMIVVNTDLGVEEMSLEELADSDHLNYGTVANGWMFAAMYNSGNKLLESMAKVGDAVCTHYTLYGSRV